MLPLAGQRTLPERIVSCWHGKSDASRLSVDAARIVIRVVGVAALLALLVVSLVGVGQPLRPGTTAPPTAGTTLEGEPFDLGRLRGGIVVVNVWASWCAPCLYELPMLVSTASRWKERGVRFVGLAAESDPADVQRIVDQLESPYPVLHIDGATQRAWNADALPSTYIVSADGVIAWSMAGALSADELEDAIVGVVGRGGVDVTGAAAIAR
jgi:cytochrome c biogenesis protein CcmG/thiol:disulfide interchange protein DsbE